MIRFILLILIILLIDAYAFQALKVLAQQWSAPVRGFAYGLFWAVPAAAAIFILALTQSHPDTWRQPWASTMRTVLLMIYFSKLIVLPFLLIDDVRRLAGAAYQAFAGPANFDLGRSRFLAQMGIFLGAIPLVTLTYGIVRNPYRYKVFRHKVRIQQLPPALEGLRIVQISDIHSGSFTFKDPVRNAIDLINEQQPDLVLFTGDLVNYASVEMAPFMDIFDKIQARHGVYSVLGNHDYGDYQPWPSAEAKAANMREMEDIHRRLGWILLRNENRQVEINGELVGIVGVENYSAYPRFPKYGDLAKAVRGLKNEALRLLLSHDPSHWRDQVLGDYPNIDITFSGHTHGMQFGVEIPGWIKWSPIKYVYREWAGLYQHGRQYLHVNRGLGFHGYPGRVGILPEITLIELEGGAQES
jgi:predicted MPP superfamily phosphohydrolase